MDLYTVFTIYVKGHNWSVTKYVYALFSNRPIVVTVVHNSMTRLTPQLMEYE